jgi:hypothetical protein
MSQVIMIDGTCLSIAKKHKGGEETNLKPREQPVCMLLQENIWLKASETPSSSTALVAGIGANYGSISGRLSRMCIPSG